MVEVKQGSITDVECDVAVVNLFRGVKYPGGATGAMDRALHGAITKAIADFDGNLGECLLLDATGGDIKADKVLVAGLGPAAGYGYLEVEETSYAAAMAAIEVGGRVIATIVHGAGIGGLDPVTAAEKVVSGTMKAFREVGGDDLKLVIVEFNPVKAKAIADAILGG